MPTVSNYDPLLKEVKSLRDAGADALSFSEDKRYTPLLDETAATVFVPADLGDKKPNLIGVSNPRWAIIKSLEIMYNYFPRGDGKISPKAYIAEDCQIGDGTTIMAGAALHSGAKVGSNTIIYNGVVIQEDAQVGNNCVLYPGASVGHDCLIGNNVLIYANADIGSDGFGFMPDGQRHYKFPQVGRTIIGDNVEIGSNTSVHRGSLEDTIIGNGTKIDSQVTVAHNVKMGQNCIVAGNCGISGSCTFGDNVVLAGMIGVADGVSVASGVVVIMRGSIARDITEPGFYSGEMPSKHRDNLRYRRALRMLTDRSNDILKLLDD